MKKILATASLCLILSACSTGYHAMGLTGGFDEFKLSNDSYMVRFSGNRMTDSSRAYKYAMRRSAELTKEKGYNYFKIIKSSSVIDKNTYVTPLRAETSSYGGYGSSSSTTTLSGGDVVTSERPTTSFVIKMYKNQAKDSLDPNIVLSNFEKR